MKFNTISMVKRPVAEVWRCMRDNLPELAAHMEDIDSIRVESSLESGNILRAVNVWQASVRLPLNMASHLDANLFSWTDHAEWHGEEQICRWRIEHHHFGDSFNCTGRTQFSPAMGGRGTRITFTGTFELNKHNMPKMLSIVEDPALKMVESMLIKLIPKNFQKITAAIESHLKASGSNGSGK